MTINRISSFITNSVLILFAVAIIIVPFYQRARRHSEQLKFDISEQRFLELNLVAVKRQGEKVLMVPTGSEFYGMDGGEKFYYRSTKPMLASKGFLFKKQDQHWHGNYTVESIEADGVLIRYEYSGSHPAKEGKFTGSVKIGWK